MFFAGAFTFDYNTLNGHPLLNTASVASPLPQLLIGALANLSLHDLSFGPSFQLPRLRQIPVLCILIITCSCPCYNVYQCIWLYVTLLAYILHYNVGFLKAGMDGTLFQVEFLVSIIVSYTYQVLSTYFFYFIDISGGGGDTE